MIILKDIWFKDTHKQYQGQKMKAKSSSMHTHVFKGRSGMIGDMFISKN